MIKKVSIAVVIIVVLMIGTAVITRPRCGEIQAFPRQTAVFGEQISLSIVCEGFWLSYAWTSPDEVWMETIDDTDASMPIRGNSTYVFPTDSNLEQFQYLKRIKEEGLEVELGPLFSGDSILIPFQVTVANPFSLIMGSVTRDITIQFDSP